MYSWRGGWNGGRPPDKVALLRPLQHGLFDTTAWGSWAAVWQGLDHQSLSCFAATVTLGTTGTTGYLKRDNFSQSNLCSWEIPVHPMLCRCSRHSVSWKGEFFQPLLTISGFASSLQVKHWECFTAMWGDLPPSLPFTYSRRGSIGDVTLFHFL